MALMLPPSLRPVTTKGVDGAVRRFEGPGMELTMDLSPHANPLTEDERPMRVVNQTREVAQDGRPARTIVFERQTQSASGRWVHARHGRAIHVPAARPSGALGQVVHLTVTLECVLAQDCEVADTIFATLQFELAASKPTTAPAP
jgi:hypothetical protein